MARRSTDENWKNFNTTAVANVSSSVASSTATGHIDLALAGNEIEYVIIKHFIPVSDPADVSERDLEEFQEKAEEYKKQAEAAGLPDTYVFRLNNDLDNCLGGAKTKRQNIMCWVSYVSGYGKVLNDWLNALNPLTGAGEN